MIKRRFLIALYLFFIVMLASGCDHSIRQVGVEFGQFPRVVYIAGVDTEIDLSDATLVTVHANGFRNESRAYRLPDLITTVEHNVDFNTPGIYKVEVVRHTHTQFYITFFVQVIDEEVFNQLKTGTR